MSALSKTQTFNIYTGTAVPAGFTSCVELTVGFLVVSIPAYRSFYKKKFKPEEKSTAWSNGERSDRAALRYKNDLYHNSNKASMMASSTKATNWSSSKSSDCGSMDHTVTVASTGEKIPEVPHGIHVTDRVELTTIPRNNKNWVQLSESEAAGTPWREV